MQKEEIREWIENPVTKEVLEFFTRLYDVRWQTAEDLQTLGRCQGAMSVLSCMKDAARFFITDENNS